MGYYDEYLEHHGILGQKWGVRRFENAAGRLTAAGKNRYNQINGEYQKLKKKVMPSKVESTGEKKKEGTDNGEEKKKGLTDKQKKMIVAGAAIAGTALAAYGGYKLYQLNDKATKGISNELNKKAAANYRASSKLQVEGYKNHDQGSKVGRETGSDLGNKLVDLSKNYFDQASLHKDLADQYRYKANSKKYSVKEKYDYLKTGKVEDSALSKLTRSQIKDEQSKRSGLKEAVNKAQSSKPAQNGVVQTSKSVARTVGTDAKTTSNVVKMNGQQKFSQASKANDDFVQELLKKNAKNLGL